MLPKSELNIYPKSDENLIALISFYFYKFDVNQEKAVEMLKEEASLTLNQIEFILRKLSEAYAPIFKKHLNGKIALTNLIAYGIDALKKVEVSSSGSKNRQLITKEFIEFAQQTEMDITRLEKNN